MKNILIFLFNLAFCAINAQQGIGTNNPDPSSILEIASTTKGLLIPRMNNTQMTAISAVQGLAVQGLMVYCTTCSPKAIYTYDTSSGNWVTSVTNSSVSIRQINSSGTIWMARDLGASRSISSTTDIASYGDLYQWGRGTDGHEKWDSTIISKTDPSSPVQNNFVFVGDNNTGWRYEEDENLWNSTGELSDNNPCPVGYRLPTSFELENHAANINLHHAGERNFNGILGPQDYYGTYWTSTSGTYIKIVGNTITSGTTTSTAFGRCVRCIKN